LSFWFPHSKSTLLFNSKNKKASQLGGFTIRLIFISQTGKPLLYKEAKKRKKSARDKYVHVSNVWRVACNVNKDKPLNDIRVSFIHPFLVFIKTSQIIYIYECGSGIFR